MRGNVPKPRYIKQRALIYTALVKEIIKLDMKNVTEPIFWIVPPMPKTNIATKYVTRYTCVARGEGEKFIGTAYCNMEVS